MPARLAAPVVIGVLASLCAIAAAPARAATATARGGVRGTVTERDQTPAADALVRLHARRDPAAGGPIWPRRVDARRVAPLARAITDGDGAFTLDGLAPGQYLLIAGCATRGLDVLAVTIEPGGVAEVTASLGKGMVLRAWVPPPDLVPEPDDPGEGADDAGDDPDDDADGDDDDDDRPRRRRNNGDLGGGRNGDTLDLRRNRSGRPGMARRFDDDDDDDDDRRERMRRRMQSDAGARGRDLGDDDDRDDEDEADDDDREGDDDDSRSERGESDRRVTASADRDDDDEADNTARTRVRTRIGGRETSRRDARAATAGRDATRRSSGATRRSGGGGKAAPAGNRARSQPARSAPARRVTPARIKSSK